MESVKYSSGENTNQLVFTEEAKMLKIAQDIFEKISNAIPYLRVKCNDSICSSVLISGSFDETSEWEYDIFENSRYFRIGIYPSPNKRIYSGGNVSIEMFSYHRCKKMRTANHVTPEKAIEKIVHWLYKEKENFSI